MASASLEHYLKWGAGQIGDFLLLQMVKPIEKTTERAPVINEIAVAEGSADEGEQNRDGNKSVPAA